MKSDPTISSNCTIPRIRSLRQEFHDICHSAFVSVTSNNSSVFPAACPSSSKDTDNINEFTHNQSEKSTQTVEQQFQHLNQDILPSLATHAQDNYETTSLWTQQNNDIVEVMNKDTASTSLNEKPTVKNPPAKLTPNSSLTSDHLKTVNKNRSNDSLLQPDSEKDQKHQTLQFPKVSTELDSNKLEFSVNLRNSTDPEIQKFACAQNGDITSCAKHSVPADSSPTSSLKSQLSKFVDAPAVTAVRPDVTVTPAVTSAPPDSAQAAAPIPMTLIPPVSRVTAITPTVTPIVRPADPPGTTKIDKTSHFSSVSAIRTSKGGGSSKSSPSSLTKPQNVELRMTTKLQLQDLPPNQCKNDPKAQNLFLNSKLTGKHIKNEDSLAFEHNQTPKEPQNEQDHTELSELNYGRLIIDGKAYSFDYFPRKIGNLPDPTRSNCELSDNSDPPFDRTEEQYWTKLKAWTKRHKEYLSYLKPEQLKQWKQHYEEEFEHQTITNQALSDIQRAIDKTKGHRRKELYKKYKEIIEMEELRDEFKEEQAELRLQHRQENKTNRPFYHSIQESPTSPKVVKKRETKVEDHRPFKIEEDSDLYFPHLKPISPAKEEANRSLKTKEEIELCFANLMTASPTKERETD